MKLAVAAVVLCTAFAAYGQVTYKPIETDPIRIDGGLVAGTYLPSGVRAYFGIPFAAPPIRQLRWRAPQPVTSWQGVLTANRMQPECYQPLRSNNINHYFGDEAAAEDCLYLNMWTPPTAKRGDKLPVVVWIYGGGFNIGSSTSPLYSGEQLAKKGVIYLGFNYRVGVFGFLAHPEATLESGHHASGNWGFLDQLAALQWVQHNIEQFGGDPGNVLLIGQSAGSMSINNLQASPLAKGLFHKLLGMSGSTLQGPGSEAASVTLQQAEDQGSKLQAALRTRSLAEMRTFSSDKVFAAAQAAQVRATPLIDGYFLPESVATIFANHQQSDVPIVVGSTANDLGTDIDIRHIKTLTEYRAAMEKTFGSAAPQALKLFPAVNDEQARAAAEQIGINSGIGLGARTWVKTQALNGKAPAYLFLFARVQPYTPGVAFADHDPSTAGAYHTGDVPYWLQTQDAFNLFRQTRNWTTYDRQLADTMSDLLINFAKNGIPRTATTIMPRYDISKEQRIIFGDNIRVDTLNTKGLDLLAAHPIPMPISAVPAPPVSPSAPRPSF